MFVRMLIVEWLKLRRSLALLLVMSAPVLVVAICVAIGLHDRKPMPLDRFAMTGTAFWAFAMLPLTITALSVLMAQMEHGPRTWDHWLALPGSRRWLFLAKATTMMTLVALMSVWLFLLLLISARVVGTVHAVSGAIDMGFLRFTLAKMFAASLLMCVIQLWTALRFRSFVPPLVVGILGTFISVAAAASREGAYFPWLMPTHILSAEPAMRDMALSIGAWGGVIVLMAMLIDLSRREA